MKQYKMEIEHFGSCSVCQRGFSLHQKYEADSGHVYGEIEMFCPADDTGIILNLEKVLVERIAERTHGVIEDLLGAPTVEIGIQEKEPKKIPDNVTELKPGEHKLEDLLDVGQVYKIVGVCRSTLYNWRKRGRGPKFFKSPFGIVFYRRIDVDAFLKTHPDGYMDMRGGREGE